MKEEQLKSLFELLSGLTPEEHARAFKEIRQFTYERITKESESFACRSKELSEFISNVIGKL